MLLVAFFFPEYASYTVQQCNISGSFWEKIVSVIFEQLRAVPCPSYSIPELKAVAELGIFFICFRYRAHRANEVTCGSHLCPSTASGITRPSITSRTSGRRVPRACGRKSAAAQEPLVAGGARLGAGGTGAPRSRCPRPPFNDCPERRPAGRPRPPPPPDWPTVVCCPVAKAMPAADWRGAGAGVREQVSLPAPGGQGRLPEALARCKAPQ